METLRRQRRAKKRARSGGFTLVELMVVVVIISILAVMAVPAMSNARDDRMAFDFARRTEQLMNRARSRATGRGAAQLFVALPDAPGGSGTRGDFMLFEALDNTAAPNGPNPVSTCRGVGEWSDAAVWVPGAVSNSARLIDGFNMNGTANSVVVKADIKAAFFWNDGTTPVFVVCVTPMGATFVGKGGSVAAAIADMQSQVLPFTGFIESQVTRGSGGIQRGLKRRVLMAGGAAARVKSE